MQKPWTLLALLVVGSAGATLRAQATEAKPPALPYCIVDTGQREFYDDRSPMRQAPTPGQKFYGQDASYEIHPPAYRDNKDGTISDLNTGLMWVQARGEKVSYADAQAGAAGCRVGNYTDWRVPTIKELYSLILFTGSFSGNVWGKAPGDIPFLDTRYFGFKFGDASQNERIIDCQDWSATVYPGMTMGNNPTIFGVNFADGRIKGYPRERGPRGTVHKLFVRYVRGNPAYGKNDFADHRNGTISDRATGLMWTREDSGVGMNWPAALQWAQDKNRQKHLGFSDWRLPNAKELQSIVDYTRAPAVNNQPAIDPVFRVTKLSDGEFPYFWSSTTHLDGPAEHHYGAAVYLAFGRAMGWMSMPPGSELRRLDVHGAGAQRSDPKMGDPSAFPKGRGPQGDEIHINNFVRLVRTEK